MHVNPETKAPRKVMDTISDNAANAALALSAATLSARSISTCAGSARCCFATARSKRPALPAGVLNHPANGVAWLADRLAAQGEYLEAGEVGVADSLRGRSTLSRAIRFTPLRPVRIGVLPFV